MFHAPLKMKNIIAIAQYFDYIILGVEYDGIITESLHTYEALMKGAHLRLAAEFFGDCVE